MGSKWSRKRREKTFNIRVEKAHSAFRKEVKKTNPGNKSTNEASSFVKIDELETLFKKYSSIHEVDEDEEGNPIEPDSDDEEEECILAPGIVKFSEDLGIRPDSSLLLVIFFKLNVSEQYKIKKDEFMNFKYKYNWTTLKLIKKGVNRFNSVFNKNTEYKKFYNYSFKYMKRPNQKSMDNSLAITTWPVVFGSKYDDLEEWCEYIKKEYKKSISKDTWECFFDFVITIGTDLSKYDPMEGAWPSTIDDYVVYLKKKRNL